MILQFLRSNFFVIFQDVILHVEDLSSEDREHQHNHVMTTLESLSKKAGADNLLDKMITIGNKLDLIDAKQIPDNILLSVSAKTEIGITSKSNYIIYSNNNCMIYRC